jgi:hypothetical protein
MNRAGERERRIQLGRILSGNAGPERAAHQAMT